MKQIITMIIAVACLASCTTKEETHTALPDAAPRVVAVQQAELRALNAFVDYTGTLQADDARDITPATTAVVKSVAVDEGDAVAAGDGALRTWMAVFVVSIRKSSTSWPLGPTAWARTPLWPGRRSSNVTKGTSRCNCLSNSLRENARAYSPKP